MPNTALNRTVVVYLTNKSLAARAYGDVVVIDTVNASSFTVTTTSGYTTTQVGVVIEPNGIAIDTLGLVAVSGWIPRVNLSTSSTIGQFIKTHTVAGQAVPHSTPIQVGTFGYCLTASATPEAVLMGSVALVTSSLTGSPDTGWAVTNVTPDKVMNANATSINELADIVGTLITTLISKGLLSA